jgi:aryl-alcohol dehydrogenase-like predicted oxidoreductase
MALQGRATPAVTAAYAESISDRIAVEHMRTAVTGLSLSSIGIGTYLGDPVDAVDAQYQAAIERALALGCNHIDTAVNYRHQRSERVIGQALAAAVARDDVPREAVVLATKGGFVPFDGQRPADPGKWVYQRYIESGLAHPNEFAANYQHCIAPAFLEAMIQSSRRNLDVDTIDIYYLHNPETQRISNTCDTFRSRMQDAFATLEDAVARDEIAAYGVATWTAFRSAPNAPDYISLTELVGLAYQVAGTDNHFRFVQMPYNLVMAEAFALANQQVGEDFLSAIAAAEALELTVTTSATLKQGMLAGPYIADLSSYFPEADTDAQRALQFARSTPGVTSALVGMSQVQHVDENLALARLRPSDAGVIQGLFPDW